MEGLGINFKLLLAQIVNFLVLLLILKKFLYKPILQFLDERKKKIEESLQNVEKINKELARIEEERKRILHQAEIEAMRTIAESKRIAQEQKEEIIDEAKRKTQEELRKGVTLARQELEKARLSLRQEVIILGEAMARKILQEKLTPEEKRKLIDEMLKI